MGIMMHIRVVREVYRLASRSSHATIIMRLTSFFLCNTLALCVYKHATLGHLETPVDFSFHHHKHDDAIKLSNPCRFDSTRCLKKAFICV